MSNLPAARPPKPDRDEALDGLRGVACLMVFFYHMGLDLRQPPLVILGYSGVHIFFVLSGYLMFGPFLAALAGDRPFPSWRRYAVRRFTRIYPPYLVALIVFTAARHATGTKPPSPANLASHVLLIFNYFDRSYFFAINVVFWSLAIEAQFYVVLPLIARAALTLARGPGRAAPAIAVIGFIALGLAARGLEVIARPTPPPDEAGRAQPLFTTVFAYLDLFGAGMAAAWAERAFCDRLRGSIALRLLPILLGGGIFIAACNWSLRVNYGEWMCTPIPEYAIAYPFLLCAGVALVLLGIVARPTLRAGLLTWGPLMWVGMVSYSLYLYHILIQEVVKRAVPLKYHYSFSGLLSLSFAAMAPTLIVSAAMYYLVERPAQRWGARDSLHKAADKSLG